MKNISVIGAGTMGNGIVHLFAYHGYNVTLIDINQESLERAMSTIGGNLDRLIKKGEIPIPDFIKNRCRRSGNGGFKVYERSFCQG